MIAADTETGLIRRALLVPPLVCVSYATPKEAGVVLHSDSRSLCEKLFQGESLWMNAPYDLAVIGNTFSPLVPQIFDALWDNRVYDVAIRQKLIDIAHGRYYKFYVDAEGKPQKIQYSLAALAKRLVGIELDKSADTWRLRYMELHDIPVSQWPAEAVEYAQKDAEILWPIFYAQEEHKDVLQNQFAQSRASFALHLMSAWGIRTDSTSVDNLDRSTHEEWEEVAKRLNKCGLIHKKGSRNTKLAKQMLIEAVGVDRCTLTEAGEKKLNLDYAHADAVAGGYIRLDEDSCVDSGVDALKDYARFGSLLKLRTTYVAALKLGVKYPLQGRYEVLLPTGRTSCSAPNLQNLPRELGVRECFVPRKGNVFIFCDYALAELCSLAQTCIEVCGYSRLAERLNAGFDPHTDMAAQILGITYEQAAAFKKSGDKHFEEIRTLGKAADFGLPGGLGPDSFIRFAKATYGLVISYEQAVTLRDKWREAWPEMQDYFRWVSRLCETGSAWVRQPMSGRCRGDIPYTVCANTFFQGRTADGAKAALAEICRRQYSVPSSALYGTRTVAFIHDEIGIEAPEDRAHEAAMEQEAVMVDQFTQFHPDLFEAVAASPSMSRHWYKKIPQVWKCPACKKVTVGENRICLNCEICLRLIPWEDRAA